ncbi:threonylcarbamoyl-AMP synthase [Desulfovibrio sp. OttesenSCG-928-F07]|nr:threonylcarbamoyl-AMP synthase [Desulfovibrio sp. OttesenSCG-928-F07]
MSNLSFEEAVSILQNDGVLVYPTETFYAIGGKATSREAAATVYQVKERDKHFPLPVIIGDISQLEIVTNDITEEILCLAEAFWPGPLTVLIPASNNVPLLLTGATGKIAVRLSAHPEARRLCIAAGAPLISSSANISGTSPVANAALLDHAIIDRLGNAVYCPEPQPAGGQPSTIVDITADGCGGKAIKILREGAVSAKQIAAHGFACINAAG